MILIENEEINENAEEKLNGDVKVRTTVLDLFRQLSKNRDNLRIKAGTSLVKYLLDNEKNENELKYALGRIIRALGSQNSNARIGFYSVLVAILNQCVISVGDVFGHVDKHLHKSSANSKSENADIYHGRILVCGAIIRSDLFATSSKEEQRRVIDCLLDSGKKRDYLLLISYSFLMDVIEKVNNDQYQKIILPKLKSEISKPLKDHNLDSLYFLLGAQKKAKESNKKEIEEGIFAADNMETLVKIITNIPRIDAITHPVYDIIVEKLLANQSSKYFAANLDQVLNKHNRNKLLLIINIADKLIEKTQRFDEIPDYLTKNLIVNVLQAFRQIKMEKDNQFIEASFKLFESVGKATANENMSEKTKLSILKKLLLDPGTLMFEKTTKSKVVQNVTSNLNADGVKKLAKIYRNIVVLKNEKKLDGENWSNNERLYVAHLFVKLLNHRAVQSESEWRIKQLRFLMELGLFKQDNVGVELAASLKDNFFRSLELKFAKAEDLAAILNKLFDHLNDSINGGALLRRQPSVEALELFGKTKTFANKKSKNGNIDTVFTILFLHMGMQLYNETQLASDSLNELFSCYERIKNKEKSQENDPEWIEVVVELFLSLLSQNSHLLRSLVKSVFPYLCENLNETAMHQILSVLDPTQENPLSDQNDDSSSDSDDENEQGENEEQEETEEDESSDDEDETINEKLKMALHKALMENSTNDQEESDVDMDDLDDESASKLDKALSDVFKQFGPNRGKRSDKREKKNDETLTHFRIRVLDLVEIFIDSDPPVYLLLEVMLTLLKALEFSVRDEQRKPLMNRVKACLKRLTGLKKIEKFNEIDETTLSNLLDNLLAKGDKNSVMVQHIATEIADCCSFIIKLSQTISSDANVPKALKKAISTSVMEKVKNALVLFFEKRECFIPFALFRHILQLHWHGNLQLADFLSAAPFREDIRPFRKSQSLELLKIFYSNHRLLNSVDEKFQTKIEKSALTFIENCSEFFKSILEDPLKFKAKERFLSLLFGLFYVIKNCSLNLTFDWMDFGETVRKCRSHFSLNAESKKSFNRFCLSVGISNVVQMQNNIILLNNGIDEDNSVLNETEPIKPKKENTKKRKKEAKQLRLQSLSEGLENGFSAVDTKSFYNVDDMEPSENGLENERVLFNGASPKKKKLKTK